MTIDFITQSGSRYTVDHTAKRFTQHYPKRRNGPLYNTPSVRIGQPVEIQTSHQAKPLLVIQTAAVKSRVVHLA